ncbi:SLC13 family permease [Cytobacillus firmus]|uniref:SLC13 family permease n=1 Tax=Cytobacillus firmus TaxID=1399 RepID=UPI0022284B49|nr:SLC13 family permease [Cytobacillus firmus]
MQTRIEKHKHSGHPMVLIDRIFMRTLAIILVHVLFLLVIFFLDGLDYKAKLSLFAFLSAMTLWVTTKFPAGYVALAIVCFIVLMKGGSQELLFNSLSEEVVWLMFGAFIIGEAVTQSGLAGRFIEFILRKSRTAGRMKLGIISFIFSTAFFIPSTSGRAAMAKPIIMHVGSRLSAGEKRILAITVPIVILMSTSAALIGAGSHIIGIGLLESASGQSISYLQWLVWGMPFALVVTILSVLVIKWMMGREAKSADSAHWDTKTNIEAIKPLTRVEKKTLLIVAFLLAGWMTENVHGYDLAFVTVLGAIVMTFPNIGVISWKQGIKSVSWNLILFVAASTALGKILVETGLVQWLEGKLTGFLFLFSQAPGWIMVLGILLITSTSHLYITSHTTRAIVLMPGIILFSQSTGISPSAAVFLSLIGMNYCITFPVSSKALLLFYEDGDLSYDAGFLTKLSAILMPVYITVAVVFYCTYWQWTGMSLH